MNPAVPITNHSQLLALILFLRKNSSRVIYPGSTASRCPFPLILDLKVGVSVMLLRNLEAPWLGLPNSSVKQNFVVQNVVKQAHSPLRQNVVKAINTLLIPQIPIIPFEGLPFTFKCLQFPLFPWLSRTHKAKTLQVTGFCSLAPKVLENQYIYDGQLNTRCIQVYSVCHRAISCANIYTIQKTKV